MAQHDGPQGRAEPGPLVALRPGPLRGANDGPDGLPAPDVRGRPGGPRRRIHRYRHRTQRHVPLDLTPGSAGPNPGPRKTKIRSVLNPDTGCVGMVVAAVLGAVVVRSPGRGGAGAGLAGQGGEGLAGEVAGGDGLGQVVYGADEG